MIISILILLVIAVSMFAYELHTTNIRDKEIKKLKKNLQDIINKSPCGERCTICQLTNSPCPGRGSCPVRK